MEGRAETRRGKLARLSAFWSCSFWLKVHASFARFCLKRRLMNIGQEFRSKVVRADSLVE